jgi:hypothetical protein
MKNKYTRRNFLKASALGAVSFSGLNMAFGSETSSFDKTLETLLNPPPQSGASVIGLKKAPMKPVRVAFIGLGNRGKDHVELINALSPEKATIVAICDIRPAMVTEALDIISKTTSGQKPDVYQGTVEAWTEMVHRPDIDLVIIATPWIDHTPMAVYCMQQGKNVGVEVPAALTVDECWQLVNTAEEHQVNCMMLENVCYGDEELWLLNMAEQGVFGTLTYGEAAYIHDLKELMFSETYYYNQWRIRHHVKYDGNLYPTHGLGPVAQYMGINRGDGFENLVSMSCLQAGLAEYSKGVNADNEFFDRSYFKHGDMNNSLIKTAKGRTILVQHDVVTYRPYSRINALAGTHGYHEGYPSRLALKGQGHGWLDKTKYDEYWNKYSHPIWTKLEAEIRKYGGHGGMDFVMIYRMIDCFNKGLPLDMDVYDAAAWSSVTPLSGISCDMGSAPVKFPDFTRGRWKEERALGIIAAV